MACLILILIFVFMLLPGDFLSDFDSLDERDQEKNNQLGFDVAEREFGISPCMTGKEMSSVVEPDKLSMVMYLSQFYEMFKETVPPGGKSGFYSRVVFSGSLFWEVTNYRKVSDRCCQNIITHYSNNAYLSYIS